MRIALAQINPTVGDLRHNVRKILDYIGQAKAQGAEVVVFPELALIGYPPKDLLLKPQFISDNLRALQMIATRVKGIDAIVGYADRNAAAVGRPLHNAVALLRDGQIFSRHYKTLLPTYDVFDESRYFEPGPQEDKAANLIQVGGTFVGLSICEDLWNDERLIDRRLYHDNPLAKLSARGSQVLINASASPFIVEKHDFRRELFASQVKQFKQPLVYVNQVGGNDELVFDGNSMVFDAAGNVIAQAKEFEEDLLVVDIPTTASNRLEKHSGGVESIYKALVLGTRDYIRKCGFKSVVLGLSGGIDSALTAAIAVDALGKDKVVGVAMPSRYSSDHSVADAKALAENLGVEFNIVPIKDVHDAYESTLAGVFKGLEPGLAEENVQARARGAILMAMSNKFNHLLLTTGNKSEIAVGYCTLYGDMCGGLAVISDVPKTTVYEMCELLNKDRGREVIPANTIHKPPSAELRPNQTDQDSLPPYAILDAILYRYVELEQGAGEIIGQGFDAATVLRIIKLIDRAEYKRRQAAPGLKVTSRAFGFGRRMPIAQNYEQQLPKPKKDGDVAMEEGTEIGWGYEPAMD
jgi:NAD+ synthase (glutamine-hydrolysing)